ncbi:MAG: ATPase, T2SS/T4P/T4SS family [Candidatus Thorarchaeota archaeon]
MSEKLVEIITCHKQRCELCQSDSGSICKKVVSLREEQPDVKIVLLEHARGVAHFEREDGASPLGPPWYVDGWETIYFGHDFDFSILEHILDTYFVGQYISIFQNTSERIVCSFVPRISTALEYNLLLRLNNRLPKSEMMRFTNRLGLSNRLDEISKIIATEIADTIPEIAQFTRERISEVIAHQSTVLGAIIPIILDDEVEEIFLDSPGTLIYFDHRRFGRCYSSQVFEDTKVSKIVTLLRSESNLHLDRRNPSLKIDLMLFDIPLRFSATIPPLSPDGFHMQIRRAKSVPYSIVDLISNNTLGIEAATMLILAINSRMNITITGGPGVGKTTLLNALDMTTPQKWRKLYIEDAIESRKYENQHQLRIKVSPVDETTIFFDKATEIVKSLHRSPDYLILGEIQTAEHSVALFQAISAGLHSIQTCHSDSASGLLTRWKTGHGISSPNLALMDVIVTLDRPIPGESFRQVREIVEIRRDVKEGITGFVGLHKLYDSQNPSERIEFAQDGAYQRNALNVGSNNPMTAYDEVVRIMEQLVHSKDSSVMVNLGEILWSSGHPMKFVTCS